MPTEIDPGRRALLRGRPRAAPPPLRPPWAAETAVQERCTRCGACAAACPEGILAAGDGGFPTVDFRHGECTFCAACADACPAGVFGDRAAAPWALAATVGPGCLAGHGVVCQSCREICEPGAIAFPRSGRPGRPVLDTDACTGCGACVAPCPAGAITVAPRATARTVQGESPCPLPSGTSPA
ncbi:ferredoxin-type protein NapF [Azospirillum sp. ST 5-10]|uniref:ferredoxin-type protein NapF n=1 Tax=Azospirillum sp. ST 5-10 TaxID=3445776 RepID=UPI003F4A7900